MTQWRIGVTPSPGVGNEGGCIEGGGDIHNAETEHGHIIYFNVVEYEDL